MKSPQFLIWIFILTALPASASASGWQRLPLPGQDSGFITVTQHPYAAQSIIAASGPHILIWNSRALQWERAWNLAGTGRILKVDTFPEVPDSIFILTSTSLFRANLLTRRLEKVFGSRNDARQLRCFFISPAAPEHWLIGTSAGIIKSADSGKTWAPAAGADESVHDFVYYDGAVYAATSSRLLRENGASFHTAFSFGGRTEELTDSGAGPDDPPSPAVTTAAADGALWLVSPEGIFQTRGGGRRWMDVPESGLISRSFRKIASDPASGRLFLATDTGVFSYDRGAQRWDRLEENPPGRQIADLLVLETDPQILGAVTDSGFYRYILLPDGITAHQEWQAAPGRVRLFDKLVLLEPSPHDIHRAVIAYNDLSPGKIKRWHAGSRLRALLPSVSFGRDYSEGNNIDLDRGSTNDPDVYITGPSQIDRGWDFGVSWDLGDFIWSSSQTSIDSRSKSTADLRHDLLAEATRLFYERRRLQTEFVFSSLQTEFARMENLLRIDELTALLDGMTGGVMSERLREMYREAPELAGLWDYRGTNLSENLHE